jgi:hypothetical protein
MELAPVLRSSTHPMTAELPVELPVLHGAGSTASSPARPSSLPALQLASCARPPSCSAGRPPASHPARSSLWCTLCSPSQAAALSSSLGSPSAVPLFRSAASSSLVLGPSSSCSHGQGCSSPCVARLSRPPAPRPTPASPAPLSPCRALTSSDFASRRSLTHMPIGVVEFLFDQLVIASFAVESSNTSSSAQTPPHQLVPDVS